MVVFIGTFASLQTGEEQVAILAREEKRRDNEARKKQDHQESSEACFGTYSYFLSCSLRVELVYILKPYT